MLASRRDILSLLLMFVVFFFFHWDLNLCSCDICSVSLCCYLVSCLLNGSCILWLLLASFIASPGWYLVDSVSAGWGLCLSQRNGDELEENSERDCSKDVRGHWLCTKCSDP